MFISYRSIFTLQRELFYQTTLRKMKQEEKDDVVESVPYDEADSDDTEESDKEDK